MEKTSVIVGDIYSNANEFIQLQARSVKLELYERITNVIASGISASFIILFGAIAFLFVNLGLAFWLSEVYHSYKIGFFMLAAAYTVLLALYLAFRHKLARNSIKNVVLHKVSKNMSDYDELLKEQDLVHAQIQSAEMALKADLEEIKGNLHTLKEDYDHIKESFVGKHDKEENKNVGPKLPRIAITSAIDFALQHLLLKKAGFVKKTLLPIVANALVTSAVFKEDKKTSLTENLKLKFAKFL